MQFSIDNVVELYSLNKHQFTDAAACVNATRFCEIAFRGTVQHDVLLVSPTVPLVMVNGITPARFPRICSSMWKLMDNDCVWQLDHTFDKLLPFVGSVHSIVIVSNEPFIIDYALNQFLKPISLDLRLCMFEGFQQPTSF